MSLGGNAYGCDFQLEVPLIYRLQVDSVFVAHITVADSFFDGVAPTRAGQPTDPLPVSKNGFATQQDDVRVVDREPDQPTIEPVRLAFDQGFAAEKVDLRAEFYRPPETCFVGRVVGRYVCSPGAIALFESKTLDRAIAGVDNPVSVAGFHQRVIDDAGSFARQVEFISKFANIGDAVKAYAKRAGFDAADFAGHSLRAGFVTSAAERGATTDRIMDHTGHRSHAMVRTYTRRSDAFSDNAGEGLL